MTGLGSGRPEQPSRRPSRSRIVVLSPRCRRLDDRLRAATELAAGFGQIGLIADPAALAEAEWLLDLPDDLLDYYFVRPAASLRRRAALDQKLEAAGKAPLNRPGKAEQPEH